jgi:CubicO group peptidase (beta-lactamase class C family)
VLAKRGRLLLEVAYGEAVRERHLPNRTDTRFNLGSINKIFTELAIAQLVQQNKVGLDDRIERYLPDYPN